MMVALDSSVVLSWMLAERHAVAIDTLLRRPGVEFVLPGPGLTEVVSRSRARGSTSNGDQILAVLLSHGIHPTVSTGTDVLLRAAKLLEASAADPYYRPGDLDQVPYTLSLGDALILAQCEAEGWRVVTRDKAWSWSASQRHTTAVVVNL